MRDWKAAKITLKISLCMGIPEWLISRTRLENGRWTWNFGILHKSTWRLCKPILSKIVGSISAALSCRLCRLRERSAGSFPEKRLVIEPSKIGQPSFPSRVCPGLSGRSSSLIYFYFLSILLLLYFRLSQWQATCQVNEPEVGRWRKNSEAPRTIGR